MLSPETWRGKTVGTVLNPRRGEGPEDQFLLADLLIKDADAIQAVRDGKREVSCGYDSDREQIRPGLGRTIKVIGNHVALVERGRCGPACAISDGDPEMPVKAKRTVWDRLRTAFAAKDEAAFEEELAKARDEEPSGGEVSPVTVHVHNGAPAAVDPAKTDDDEPAAAAATTAADPLAEIKDILTKMDARLTKLETAAAPAAAATDDDPDPDAGDDPMIDEDPKKKDDDEKKGAMDSAPLRADFQDVISRAEILAPGIKLPVFDAKAKRKMTVDAMCALRVSALEKAYHSNTNKIHVVAVLGAKKPDFKGMTCDTATMIFRAASELAKAANNKGAVQAAPMTRKGPMTAADVQARIEERRKSKKA
jgi:hypothetical protein